MHECLFFICLLVPLIKDNANTKNIEVISTNNQTNDINIPTQLMSVFEGPLHSNQSKLESNLQHEKKNSTDNGHRVSINNEVDSVIDYEEYTDNHNNIDSDEETCSHTFQMKTVVPRQLNKKRSGLFKKNTDFFLLI